MKDTQSGYVDIPADALVFAPPALAVLASPAAHRAAEEVARLLLDEGCGAWRAGDNDARQVPRFKEENMQKSEDGTVTGSINVNELPEPKTDEAKAQQEALLAEQKAGQEAQAEQAGQVEQAEQGVETPSDDQPETTEAPEEYGEQDLSSLTKAQVVELAEQKGLYTEGKTKADLVAELGGS